jgi:hypothetical protein
MAMTARLTPMRTMSELRVARAVTETWAVFIG